VSNAQWPMMWPSPYPMSTTLAMGGDQPSRIVLPVVPSQSPVAPPKFTALPALPPAPPADEWTTERDQFRQGSKWIWRTPESSFELPWGKIRRKHSIEFAVEDAHPEMASACGNGETAAELDKRIWRYLFKLRGDQVNFYYDYTRTLLENGRII